MENFFFFFGYISCLLYTQYFVIDRGKILYVGKCDVGYEIKFNFKVCKIRFSLYALS